MDRFCQADEPHEGSISLPHAGAASSHLCSDEHGLEEAQVGAPEACVGNLEGLVVLWVVASGGLAGLEDLPQELPEGGGAVVTDGLLVRERKLRELELGAVEAEGAGDVDAHGLQVTQSRERGRGHSIRSRQDMVPSLPLGSVVVQSGC